MSSAFSIVPVDMESGGDVAKPDASGKRTTQQNPTTTLLHRSLEAIYRWYVNMIDPKTHRLTYEYQPEKHRGRVKHVPIRYMASLWDIAALQRFLQVKTLDPVLREWLDHYLSFAMGWVPPQRGEAPAAIVEGKMAILDSAKLGEACSIAHNAFLILCLTSMAPSDEERRIEYVRQLANAIVSQQREDGAYRIHFERGLPDVATDLYPGEAMLALLRAYEFTGDGAYVDSVEKAFNPYRIMYMTGRVDSENLIFFANWISQAFCLLHRLTQLDVLKVQIKDFLYRLHEGIIRTGYYENLVSSPKAYSTVEVACALEGLADVYLLAKQEDAFSMGNTSDEGSDRDPGEPVSLDEAVSSHSYSKLFHDALSNAFGFLLQVQGHPTDSHDERCLGGFGESLVDHTQRVDVTGHVANGLIKLLKAKVRFTSLEI